MKQRIKQLRITLNLNQERFGEKLGLSKSAISNIESGRYNLTDTVVIGVCNVFNVNEEWLRAGEGEMFVGKPEAIADELMTRYGLDDLDVAMILEYAKLDKGQRSVIKQYLNSVLASINRVEDNASTLVQSSNQPEEVQIAAAIEPRAFTLEEEADEFAAMTRKQFLKEKKQELEIFSAKRYGAAL